MRWWTKAGKRTLECWANLDAVFAALELVDFVVIGAAMERNREAIGTSGGLGFPQHIEAVGGPVTSQQAFGFLTGNGTVNARGGEALARRCRAWLQTASGGCGSGRACFKAKDFLLLQQTVRGMGAQLAVAVHQRGKAVGRLWLGKVVHVWQELATDVQLYHCAAHADLVDAGEIRGLGWE